MLIAARTATDKLLRNISTPYLASLVHTSGTEDMGNLPAKGSLTPGFWAASPVKSFIRMLLDSLSYWFSGFFLPFDLNSKWNCFAQYRSQVIKIDKNP